MRDCLGILIEFVYNWDSTIKKIDLSQEIKGISKQIIFIF